MIINLMCCVNGSSRSCAIVFSLLLLLCLDCISDGITTVGAVAIVVAVLPIIAAVLSRSGFLLPFHLAVFLPAFAFLSVTLASVVVVIITTRNGFALFVLLSLDTFSVFGCLQIRQNFIVAHVAHGAVPRSGSLCVFFLLFRCVIERADGPTWLCGKEGCQRD